MARDVGDASEHNCIHLTVHDMIENTNMAFKLKKRTLFSKVMTAFIQRTDMVRTTLIFQYHFHIIRESDTPSSLGIVNGDIINAYYSPPPERSVYQCINNIKYEE
ncbi:uncharacterized protein LOC132947141 [Metopolophium dirhodum]|uniref:uncharacterized protein LOC132947141 n=1 Tax=Metopolophium dirhodum TaxID=44670 RepID=UPI00298FFD84|nr:uncharacterized protein LOC132947141 [Metopolophium dirhodum]